jgi:penicillin-binding protein 1B
MLTGAIMLVGSLFMRKAVIKRLTARALASSGLVMSRPLAMSIGDDFEKLRLSSRLKRLGYYKTSQKLSRPGEYRDLLAENRFQIYLREFRLGDKFLQRQAPHEVLINSRGEIESIRDTKFAQDRKNIWLEPEMLAVLGNSDTRAVSPKRLVQYPQHLKQAVLAIEDERFRSHFGIDPVSIARAMLVNIKAGKVVQGGSTLTQQLAKNLFFTSERTIVRKITEAFSALLIETAFTKDQILEFYLNEIFLGQEGRVAIHGFGEASKTFFNRDVSQLSIAEAATLAGIIKGPSAYSPRRHPKRAKTRRNLVLKKMKELGFINATQFDSAMNTPIQVSQSSRSRRKAPYFVDYVRRTIPDLVDPELFGTANVRVFTGLDLEYQQCAEQAVTQGLKDLETKYKKIRGKEKVQAALVAVSPSNGSTLAWVGGRSFSNSQFDRVSLAKRQPGSAFKPFVFLTALDRNLNNYRVARTTSVLLDEPLTLKQKGSENWKPQNYDRKYRGEVTVRQALAHSLNVPTVNLAMKVGVDQIARTASYFGFGDDLPRVPSLALGAGEVTPLELAKAYNALANGGRLAELRPILAVALDTEEGNIYEAPLREQSLVSEPAVFVLTNILRSVVEEGTAQVVRRLGFSAPAAGKTGTSNDGRDSWFAGYTPHLLAVVWVGYDSGKPLRLTGSQAAAPIWTAFMKCTATMEPELEFIPPPGVVYRDIDARNGLLDDGYCPSQFVVREVYVEGTEPLTNSRCGGVLNDSIFSRKQSQLPSDRNPKNRERAEGIVSSILRVIFGK